ncbi:MAG: glutamate--tRNA ligase [Thermoplasmata archaeon]|nr:MAG: glutamate--tRNA ligase [Thermoplasmata archaeon]
MQIEEIREIALKYSLQNAIQFNGKAQEKAVLGKVIGALKEKGYNPRDIIPIVKKVVEEVNRLSFDIQREKLEEIAPELLYREKKTKEYTLPPLPNAEKGKVVTRFPPEPNGYLHIGHAKAAIMDYEYAKLYDGKFILRFDDTNPDKDKLEFYDAQKEDLQWLGIEWDEEYNTSDHLSKHYKLAEQLIQQGDAYVCNCTPEEIKKNRKNRIACKCRSNSIEENLELWEGILSHLTGYILRLKGDMKSDNTAMRDPTLFRIIETPHPIQGDKYRVWPTYDFAGAVEDSISGVTHPFRTKEYELRDECYFYLLDKLGLRRPYLLEFSRLSIEGMPVSKRKINPLIEKGVVTGFDDIRLPTLRGLKRRGITKQAIRNFVISQGVSKTEATVSFSLLEAENRKILDPIARRFFFIKDPIKLIVENAPEKKKAIPYHPSNRELGERIFETDKIFYIPFEDIDSLREGVIFRLKDLFNIRILEKNKVVYGEYIGEELIPDTLRIQWTTSRYIPITVFIPHSLYINDEFNENSLEEIHGIAEESIKNTSHGEIIQFERFGFVRIEHTDKGIIGFFTHR